MIINGLFQSVLHSFLSLKHTTYLHLQLHLQSMRLGSVIALTRPLLLQAIDADIEQPSKKTALEFGVAKLAHVW